MVPQEIFYPDSIAIVGASSDEEKEKIGWLGRLQQFGYRGRLYPINPKASKILGCQAYPSVMDIPEPVDYAIIVVKAEWVPPVLKDCIAKEVKVAHIFTAGFEETGKEKDKELQADLKSIIAHGKTRVIGPNCMGVYCPSSGLTFSVRFSSEAGPVGVVSQTGAGMMGLVPQANKRGIRFSKVVSYGNGIDLDAAELLGYFAEDTETRIVFCYLEGLKHGRFFFEAARKCRAKNKPLILLKGGMTKAGQRAAASHTGSLAGEVRIWQAFFKQTGAVPVYTLDEAVEQIVAFQHFRPPKGRAVGIVARGGGPGVIATDQCEKAGFSVPALLPNIRSQLEILTPAEAGSSVANPVEIGLGRAGLSEYYAEGLKLVASDPNIDMILTILNPHLYTQFGVGSRQIEDTIEVLTRVAKELTKPMAVVMPLGDSVDTIAPVLKAHEKGISEGLAVFSDMETAVKAMSKVIQYNEFVQD